MGEAKPEQSKAESKPEEKAEEQKEEKPEEKKEEKPEEKKGEEQTPPPPPPPVILLVDMHCVGCAKRVERCIMKVRGVEEVKIDMTQNQITVKGTVDPQALCGRIQKKTNRRAKVLSPMPPPEADPTKPQIVTSQVSGVSTVVLHINMHCEACADQLKKKILKMRGVQSAETDLKSSKVTVTGTMDADRLVDYVYRRTRKQAKIVLPLEEEAAAAAEEKPAEEAPKAQEKKEEGAEKKEEDKDKVAEEKKEEDQKPVETGAAAPAAEQAAAEETKKEAVVVEEIGYPPLAFDDSAKKIMYWPPVYVIERVPPPQLFSDENPNACCIS